jgi:hypothetical protein
MAVTAWIACFENHAHNGMLVGELSASWDGGEFRIALFEPEPPLYLRFPGEAERSPRLPSFTLSLWPPLILSLVAANGVDHPALARSESARISD